MNGTDRDQGQTGHSETYSAETQNDFDQVDQAISRLIYALTAVEDVDGRRAIEWATKAARQEETDSSMCYPAKAGALESSVDRFGSRADRAEEAIEEAIEILRDLQTEGSR